MAGPFQSEAGYDGSLVIDGTFWPASRWNVVTTTEQIPIPTIASCPNVDMLPGWTTGTIIATGIGQLQFNPFSGPGMPLNGTYHHVRLQVNFFRAFDFPSALILRWDYSEDVDGLPIWSMMAAGDYQFTDLGNNFTGITGVV